MQDLLAASPFIALIISLLALLVTIDIAKRQATAAAILAQKNLDAASAVARRQIISPIRQKWIDELRSNVVELLTGSQTYWIYPKDQETVHRNLLLMLRKIELMLNPLEADHRALLGESSRLIDVVLRRKDNTALSDFLGPLERATSAAQTVLKREWERVKKEE